MKVYVDTNVFIDYAFNRSDNLRPIGEFAFEFFKRTINCEFEIIISEYVIQELEKVVLNYEELVLSSLVNKKKLSILNLTKKQERESNQLAKKYLLPKTDLKHAIVARDLDCTIITRDKHFQEISKVKEFNELRVMLPEEI